MIQMLVRYEDARQRFWCSPDALETLANLPKTETRIDEDAGVIAFQIGAVTT
jgi:hypothetical protein